MAVKHSRLQRPHESDTIVLQIPDGFTLVLTADYERMKQAYLELQQVVNPLFGLDRLQTGKQRRRERG